MTGTWFLHQKLDFFHQASPEEWVSTHVAEASLCDRSDVEAWSNADLEHQWEINVLKSLLFYYSADNDYDWLLMTNKIVLIMMVAIGNISFKT